MKPPLRLATVAAAALAISAAPAVAAPLTFTVKEGSANNVVAQGVTTFFTGMYSLDGSPRGHVMGVEPTSGGRSLTFAFGSGARIVARQAPGTTGSASRLTIVGGTGRFLGATGVVDTRSAKGVYTHTVTYRLPPRGTPRTSMAYVVRLGKAQIVPRGAAQGLGNGRVIAGTVANAAGTKVGDYSVDSTLVFVYGAGTYEWYSGDFGYVFADGTLQASGPYQRATAAAPGALKPSGRVVTGGTGAYAGMRGQVVVTPNPDGTSVHSFTLIRR